MPIINILTYNSAPSCFTDWLKPSTSYMQDSMEIKEKVFNKEMTTDIDFIATVLTDAQTFHSAFFNCGQKNDCPNPCEHMLANPNCVGRSNSFYGFATNSIKRKIKLKASNLKILYFLLLFDIRSTFQEPMELHWLLDATDLLVVADDNDKLLPTVKQALKYAKAHHRIKNTVCCGNPLYWNNNYINQNVKILYRS